jgi:hypothetical protein
MNLDQQKERALTFLKNFEKPDPQVFADLIADDFEFEMMGRLPGVAPTRGKEAFLKSTPATRLRRSASTTTPITCAKFS